jgi:hypothetical protein
LYVGQNFKPTYDVVLMVCVCQLWALAGAIQVSVDIAIYRGMQFEVNTRRDILPTYTPMKSRHIPELRFEQVVAAPKVDMERHVAIALLQMRDVGSKVDLTERKWVESKKFTYDKFDALRESWKADGIIEKGDKTNATYEVVDWQKVRMKAEGVPLPHL